MSNHYHIVVEVEPRRVMQWSDAEVVRRWQYLRTITSKRTHRYLSAASVLKHPERIRELRARLGSLSWYMRYINEPMARISNHVDGCKGHFWEGRFKSIALLDEVATLSCMAYVDLNPVRARLATKLH